MLSQNRREESEENCDDEPFGNVNEHSPKESHNPDPAVDLRQLPQSLQLSQLPQHALQCNYNDSRQYTHRKGLQELSEIQSDREDEETRKERGDLSLDSRFHSDHGSSQTDRRRECWEEAAADGDEGEREEFLTGVKIVLVLLGKHFGEGEVHGDNDDSNADGVGEDGRDEAGTGYGERREAGSRKELLE